MTKHRMKDKYRKDEEPEGTAGGWCLLVAAGSGVMLAIVLAAPDLAVVLVWVALVLAIWKANKSVRGAANPAPPPVPERGPEQEPQVSTIVVKDPTHPNRWAVAETTPWLNWAPDDNETGTSS